MAWIKYLASILLCLSMLSATATVERKNSTLFFGFYDDPDGDAVVPAGANVVITEKINANVNVNVNGDIQSVLFFKVESTFLKHVGPGKIMVPNPNWRYEWETLRKKLDPLVMNGTIAGFSWATNYYVLVSLDFIAVMAKTVAETYPNTNVWYNEGSGEVVKPKKCTNTTKFYIPSHVSLFSTDIYHYSFEPGWVKRKVKSFYESYIFPLLEPSSQQAALVPGSFSSTTGGPKDQPCDSTCYRKMVMQDSEEYFRWAVEDARVRVSFMALAGLSNQS